MAVVLFLLLRRFFGTVFLSNYNGAASLDIFKRQLKTVLFRRAFSNWWLDCGAFSVLNYFIFRFCSFLLWFLNFNFYCSFNFFELVNSALGPWERALYKYLIIIIIIIIIIIVKRLMRSSKTNYERMTGELTIWLTIEDCLTVTIDGSP